MTDRQTDKEIDIEACRQRDRKSVCVSVSVYFTPPI